jgi:hypothetical protein
MATGIYRITHFKNLPFILENGLHCHSSNIQDPNFVPIGYPTLISQRDQRVIPLQPGGNLADYIPFYFSVRSPMLYVIHCANDPEVIKTNQSEIVYLVSSVEQVIHSNLNYVFSDRHARLEIAEFFNRHEDLDRLHWNIIHSRDWGRQYGPERREIKQAEFLIHKTAPADIIAGIAVHSQQMAEVVNDLVLKSGRNIPVKVKQEWYF